jgi:hypothetical protein
MGLDAGPGSGDTDMSRHGAVLRELSSVGIMNLMLKHCRFSRLDGVR